MCDAGGGWLLYLGAFKLYRLLFTEDPLLGPLLLSFEPRLVGSMLLSPDMGK